MAVFTEQERRFVIENYPTMNTDEIAKKLNKTRKQIMSCASYNKVKKERFTEEEEKFIIENYSTMSNEKLAEKLNKPDYRIIKFANKLGLTKETYRFFSEEEKQYILYNYNKISTKEIADYIGVTVKKVNAFAWHNGVLKNKKYYIVNEKYFDKIDDEHKAYWLGFLYADGSIVEQRNNSNNIKSLTLSLELKTGDKLHIEKFNKDLQSDYLITDRLTNDNHLSSKVSISNTKLCRSLINKGCVPRKSLILTFPNEDILPKNLINHFIRGYFDGDGSIAIGKTRRRYTVSFVGTWDFFN